MGRKAIRRSGPKTEWEKTADIIETHSGEYLKRYVENIHPQQWILDVRVGLVGMKGSDSVYNTRFPDLVEWYVVRYEDGKLLGTGDTPDDAVMEAEYHMLKKSGYYDRPSSTQYKGRK